MAIRNIAHDIQTGEISLGLAIGMESMSLKYVVQTYYRVCKKLTLGLCCQSSADACGFGRGRRQRSIP